MDRRRDRRDGIEEHGSSRIGRDGSKDGRIEGWLDGSLGSPGMVGWFGWSEGQRDRRWVVKLTTPID